MKQKNEKEKQNSSETQAEPAAMTLRQRTDEFCKRLGIKQANRQGGREFSPYHGGHHSTKKPSKSSKD